MLMEAFHANHYAMKSMTPEIRMHAVDQMIKRLDPSKTLLYESDLEKLKPLLLEVFASAEKGNCTSLQPVYDLLVARARENEAIVKKILGPDFRLDETVKLNINVDKRPYPKTLAEKQELLRKIVQFQIENALLARALTWQQPKSSRYTAMSYRRCGWSSKILHSSLRPLREAFAGPWIRTRATYPPKTSRTSRFRCSFPWRESGPF